MLAHPKQYIIWLGSVYVRVVVFLCAVAFKAIHNMIVFLVSCVWWCFCVLSRPKQYIIWLFSGSVCFGDVSVCWCVQNKIHNMIMMVLVYVFGGVIVSGTMCRMLLCVL